MKESNFQDLRFPKFTKHHYAYTICTWRSLGETYSYYVSVPVNIGVLILPVGSTVSRHLWKTSLRCHSKLVPCGPSSAFNKIPLHFVDLLPKHWKQNTEACKKWNFYYWAQFLDFWELLTSWPFFIADPCNTITLWQLIYTVIS